MKPWIAHTAFGRPDRTRRRWAPAQPGDELAPMKTFSRQQSSLEAAAQRARTTTGGSSRRAHISWYTRVMSLVRHGAS